MVNKLTRLYQMNIKQACQFYNYNSMLPSFQVVLCFSPVGTTLRVRSRKFPAVVNCTSIDWFHEWPQEALISVSKRFLDSNELLPVSVDCKTISCFLVKISLSEIVPFKENCSSWILDGLIIVH